MWAAITSFLGLIGSAVAAYTAYRAVQNGSTSNMLAWLRGQSGRGAELSDQTDDIQQQLNDLKSTDPKDPSDNQAAPK